MKATQKRNVNIRKTVENTVNGQMDFHFFVDELAADDSMPTYRGKADQKYKFEKMDDEFFEFLESKAMQNGVFIRLVFAMTEEKDDETVFKMEYGNVKDEFKTDEMDKVFEFEFADYGVKIKGNTITFGASVVGEDERHISFGEFGGDCVDENFLSLDNPFNQYILKIMKDRVV